MINHLSFEQLETPQNLEFAFKVPAIITDQF